LISCLPLSRGAALEISSVFVRRAFALLLLFGTAACGSDAGSKLAAAAITTGAAVAAAAVNRAITGECWAACPNGYGCDEATGKCVQLSCYGDCPPDSRCIRRGGREECVRGYRDVIANGGDTEIPPAPEDMGDAGAAATPLVEPDPCRGLCLSNERCEVSDAGVADCVMKKMP